MCKAVQRTQERSSLSGCGVPHGSRGTEGQELKLFANDLKKKMLCYEVVP